MPTMRRAASCPLDIEGNSGLVHTRRVSRQPFLHAAMAPQASDGSMWTSRPTTFGTLSDRRGGRARLRRTPPASLPMPVGDSSADNGRPSSIAR